MAFKPPSMPLVVLLPSFPKECHKHSSASLAVCIQCLKCRIFHWWKSGKTELIVDPDQFKKLIRCSLSTGISSQKFHAHSPTTFRVIILNVRAGFRGSRGAWPPPDRSFLSNPSVVDELTKIALKCTKTGAAPSPVIHCSEFRWIINDIKSILNVDPAPSPHQQSPVLLNVFVLCLSDVCRLSCVEDIGHLLCCLLYTSPSPRD